MATNGRKDRNEPPKMTVKFSNKRIQDKLDDAVKGSLTPTRNKWIESVIGTVLGLRLYLTGDLETELKWIVYFMNSIPSERFQAIYSTIKADDLMTTTTKADVLLAIVDEGLTSFEERINGL